MEQLLLEILEALRSDGGLDEKGLKRLIDRRNREAGSAERTYSKKKLLPFYLRVKAEEPDRWRGWGITGQDEARLYGLLRMKPHRTASGVATITVITKPWPCSSDCIYCPNDLRMPKSYLHDEPACRRAERNFFDPYMQVASRLRALLEMGHPCDKVELIVLGGTWTDYPQGYRSWFVSELFRALNDGEEGFGAEYEGRKRLYEEAGISRDETALESYVRIEQEQIDAYRESFSHGIERLYGASIGWKKVASWQNAGRDELELQQRANEVARHRVVGLVVETRPDCIDSPTLVELRKLGCTKVQIGVQSLRQDVLDANERGIRVQQIKDAFSLLRLFGFKIHAHFMMNLLGSSPERDVADYRRLVTDGSFMPDEVKLYPCALIGGTRLVPLFEDGRWRPYDEETLVGVLEEDVLATPAFCRVSRMIRDFSAGDIVAGNKKANLRQMVESRLRESGAEVREIRFREIGLGRVDVESLRLQEVCYETEVAHESFLQWVNRENAIAGFCRLSLPKRGAVAAAGAGLPAGEFPIGEGEAMIREVHVYGSAARLGRKDAGAQHLGLGRRLVERACEIARDAGYARVHVISAVGTRPYYRKLGFADDGLYQTREL